MFGMSKRYKCLECGFDFYYHGTGGYGYCDKCRTFQPVHFLSGVKWIIHGSPEIKNIRGEYK